jgi:hypothetical protein
VVAGEDDAEALPALAAVGAGEADPEAVPVLAAIGAPEIPADGALADFRGVAPAVQSFASGRRR